MQLGYHLLARIRIITEFEIAESVKPVFAIKSRPPWCGVESPTTTPTRAGLRVKPHPTKCQVQLDDGRLIFAPVDEDTCIKGVSAQPETTATGPWAGEEMEGVDSKLRDLYM